MKICKNQKPQKSTSKKKKTMVCETIGPIDNALSGMHEAEVQVFSDSVPCLGKQAMNMRTVH